MDVDKFSRLLENSDNFRLRRVVERLRDGLFDPLGVRMLTTTEARLNRVFDKGVLALADNKAVHLCILGSYGQGKSHSLTYLSERALNQGFVVSRINLDPREIPFHDFRQVYAALISAISFPGSDETLAQYWRRWFLERKTWGKSSLEPIDIIPDSMPHFFKAVLTALANRNMRLSPKKRGLKKHITFRPGEFPWLLANALKGENLPVYRLRHALKYREVSFYKEASLVCKGWKPYFQAVCSLAEMFQNMDFKGWVLLFDEGESIGQRPVNIRRKSYVILDRMLAPTSPLPGLYPVFAFTDDFFMQVQDEDYERVRTGQDCEYPYFEKNYGRAWRNLNFHRLHDLSAKDWQNLTAKLTRLHARAYNWEPMDSEIADRMSEVLAETGGEEARLKIKALVEQLDIAQQKTVLDKPLFSN